MMTMWHPADVVIHDIAERLREEEWFEAHRVTIIEQNSGDFATEAQKSLAQVGGVVVVVGVSHIANNGQYCDVSLEVTATEPVVMNRETQGFATAIDVAEAVAQTIPQEIFHWNDISYESPAEGVLQATATFNGLILREDIEGVEDYEINKED